MCATITRFGRVLIVSFLLGVCVTPALGDGRDRAPTQVSDHEPAGDPVMGFAILAGVVAVFVFLAWLAVRVSSGQDHPADKVPN